MEQGEGHGAPEPPEEESSHHEIEEAEAEAESLLDMIVRLNRNGVGLLQRHLFSQAATTFAHALRVVLGHQAALASPSVRQASISFPEAIVSVASSQAPSEGTTSEREEPQQQEPQQEQIQVGGEDDELADASEVVAIAAMEAQQEDELSEPIGDPDSLEQQQVFDDEAVENNDLLLLENADQGHWSSTFRIYNKPAIISLSPSADLGQSQQAIIVISSDIGERDDVRPSVASREQSQEEQEQDQPHQRSRTEDDFMAAQVSSSLLFNAGLAHHLRGFAPIPARSNPTATSEAATRRAATMTQNLQTALYRKSLRLYRAGVSVLRSFFERYEQQRDTANTEDPNAIPMEPHQQEEQEQFFQQIRPLYMALTNNMAHIHLYFANHQAHTQCCNVMRAVLATQTQQQQQQQQQQDDDDQHFYMLNLLASQNLERHAAATA